MTKLALIKLTLPFKSLSSFSTSSKSNVLPFISKFLWVNPFLVWYFANVQNKNIVMLGKKKVSRIYYLKAHKIHSEKNTLIKNTAPPPNHSIHSIWQGCLKTKAKSIAEFVCLKLSKVESNYHHNWVLGFVLGFSCLFVCFLIAACKHFISLDTSEFTYIHSNSISNTYQISLILPTGSYE